MALFHSFSSPSNIHFTYLSISQSFLLALSDHFVFPQLRKFLKISWQMSTPHRLIVKLLLLNEHWIFYNHEPPIISHGLLLTRAPGLFFSGVYFFLPSWILISTGSLYFLGSPAVYWRKFCGLFPKVTGVSSFLPALFSGSLHKHALLSVPPLLVFPTIQDAAVLIPASESPWKHLLTVVSVGACCWPECT